MQYERSANDGKRRRRALSASLAFTGWMLMAGCAESPAEIAAVATPARLPEPQSAPAAAQPAAADSITPTAAGAERTEDADEYRPPFPERVEMFVEPRRQGAAPTEAPVHRAVELMGFVRVDRPRAVVSIDGAVASLAEGEAEGGVRVVTIAPPSVTLERGRQRWQISLE